MYNADGTVRGVARAYEDITDRVRAEEQLKRIAHYDQLTGLPNRLTLQKELGRLLSGRRHGPTAIALFDLDGFKDVNDTLGHSTGDQLLIEVGQRLVEVAGGRGQVCRLGGDEFVMIMPDCGDPLVIGEIVDTMLKRLAEPFKISDHVLHVGGSAGIAIAPTDGNSVDELIANADLALYQAKSAGGRAYRFFLPVLRAQAQARRSLDLELRRAYAENEFELYFQPQVRLADGAVVGAEALLRWRHPVAGILAPGAFIDTLAASAIAPEVSRWIIRTACAKTARMARRGPAARPHRASTCSRASSATRRCCTTSTRRCARPACRPRRSNSRSPRTSRSTSRTPTVLQKIHDRGIKLAFDDFGTGYASLSYLTRFPLARIKIDRSFVGKITDDAGDAAIVRSLIAMAHNLGLEVDRRRRGDDRPGGVPARTSNARRRRAISTPSRCRPPNSRPICATDAWPTTSSLARNARPASSSEVGKSPRGAITPRKPEDTQRSVACRFQCRQARSASLGIHAPRIGDLAGRQEAYATEDRGLDLLARIGFGDDRVAHALTYRFADRNGAMAAQQHHPMWPERTRERARLRHSADIEIAFVVDAADVEHGRALAEERRTADHRPQPCVAVAERNEARGMVVTDRHHIRPRLVDFAVDDALEEQPVLARTQGPVVEIELDDVVGGNLGRRHAAGEPIAIGITRIARADVAVGVEDAAVGENAIGRDEIVDQF